MSQGRAAGERNRGGSRGEFLQAVLRLWTSGAKRPSGELRLAFGESRVLMDDGDVKTDWMLVMAGAGIYMGPRWKRRPGHSAGAAGFALADWIETERSNIRLFFFLLPPPPPLPFPCTPGLVWTAGLYTGEGHALYLCDVSVLGPFHSRV